MTSESKTTTVNTRAYVGIAVAGLVMIIFLAKMFFVSNPEKDRRAEIAKKLSALQEKFKGQAARAAALNVIAKNKEAAARGDAGARKLTLDAMKASGSSDEECQAQQLQWTSMDAGAPAVH